MKSSVYLDFTKSGVIFVKAFDHPDNQDLAGISIYLSDTNSSVALIGEILSAVLVDSGYAYWAISEEIEVTSEFELLLLSNKWRKVNFRITKPEAVSKKHSPSLNFNFENFKAIDPQRSIRLFIEDLQEHNEVIFVGHHKGGAIYAISRFHGVIRIVDQLEKTRRFGYIEVTLDELISYFQAYRSTRKVGPITESFVGKHWDKKMKSLEEAIDFLERK